MWHHERSQWSCRGAKSTEVAPTPIGERSGGVPPVREGVEGNAGIIIGPRNDDNNNEDNLEGTEDGEGFEVADTAEGQ